MTLPWEPAIHEIVCFSFFLLCGAFWQKALMLKQNYLMYGARQIQIYAACAQTFNLGYYKYDLIRYYDMYDLTFFAQHRQ